MVEPTNLKPRARSSALMASDSGLVTAAAALSGWMVWHKGRLSFAAPAEVPA